MVLYARSGGTWWVQPLSNKPFTDIDAGGAWQSRIHLGAEYAALLVEPGFVVPRRTVKLPQSGNGVVAIQTTKGTGNWVEPTPDSPVAKRLQFSGYDWEVRQVPADVGAGVQRIHRAENAWVDNRGWMHLRVAREGDIWTCGEVNLLRSLGYGTYRFTVREMPEMESGTVFGMFTWDEDEAGQNHREIDVELSQWGDPAVKNAQFVVQPYYVPANVFRFASPAGTLLVHSFRWEPGRISFRTAASQPGGKSIAEHDFTSGIPSPGGETVHLNLHVYGRSRTPQRNGAEVVIEKFEFLP
jgi:hypothetical protein